MKTLTFQAMTAVAVVTAALLMFTGSAFASSFTSKGSIYEGEIGASGSVSFEGSECESTIKGQSKSATGYVLVELSQMSFTKCQGGTTVTAAPSGALKVAPFVPSVAIVGVEVTLTIVSHLTGKTCKYVPSGTFSRFYPSSSTGGTAKIEIIQPLKLEEGPFCAENIEWSGSYTVNTPDELNIH